MNALSNTQNSKTFMFDVQIIYQIDFRTFNDFHRFFPIFTQRFYLSFYNTKWKMKCLDLKTFAGCLILPTDNGWCWLYIYIFMVFEQYLLQFLCKIDKSVDLLIFTSKYLKCSLFKFINSKNLVVVRRYLVQLLRVVSVLYYYIVI